MPVVQQIKDQCKTSTIPTEYLKRKLCDYLYDLASEQIQVVYRRKKIKFIGLLKSKMKADILYDLRNTFINNEIESLISYFTPAAEQNEFFQIKK